MGKQLSGEIISGAAVGCQLGEWVKNQFVGNGSDTPELVPARIDVGACLHAMNAGRGAVFRCENGQAEGELWGNGIACKQAPTPGI